MRLLVLAASLSLALMTQGCGTIFWGKTPRTMEVTSVPTGAKATLIFFSGKAANPQPEELGQTGTPGSLLNPSYRAFRKGHIPTSRYEVLLEKEGFKPIRLPIKVEPDAGCTLVMVIGAWGIISGIVDLINAPYCYPITPSKVEVTLEKK